jgi:hypothetical protein
MIKRKLRPINNTQRVSRRLAKNTARTLERLQALKMTQPKQSRENDIDRALARVGAKRLDPLHDSPAQLLAEARAICRELGGLNDREGLEFFERRQDVLREESERFTNALVLFQNAYWRAVTLVSEIRGAATYASDKAMQLWEPFVSETFLVMRAVRSELATLHSVGGSDMGFDIERFAKIMLDLHNAIDKAIQGDSSDIRAFAGQSAILDELRAMAPVPGRPKVPEYIVTRSSELYLSPERRPEWRDVAIQMKTELLSIKKPTGAQRLALDWFVGNDPDQWAKNLRQLYSRRRKEQKITLVS